MGQLTGPTQAAGQPLYSSNADPVHALGERMVTADGRRFVYCKAGISDLVAGNWIQSAAQIADHQNIAPTATFAAGVTAVTVTLGGSTVATANQYAGGMMVVTITPGLGQAMLISGHPAAGAGATLVLTLADPLRVTVTTTTRVDLVPNPYNGVVQTPTTLTGAAVGVAPYVITASQYGWLQTWGLGAALIVGSSPIVGSVLSLPGSTAGACVADPANAAVALCGVVAATGATGETNGVFIQLS